MRQIDIMMEQKRSEAEAELRSVRRLGEQRMAEVPSAQINTEGKRVWESGITDGNVPYGT